MRTKIHPLLRIANKYIKLFDQPLLGISRRRKTPLYRAGYIMFSGGHLLPNGVTIFHKPIHAIPRETKEQILRILKQIPELKTGISTFTLAQILGCNGQTALMIMWWGEELGLWSAQPSYCIYFIDNPSKKRFWD